MKNINNEKKYIPIYLLLALLGLVLLVLGVALGSKLENGLLMGALTGAGVVLLGNGAWKVIGLSAMPNTQETDSVTRIQIENARLVKMKAAWITGRFLFAAMGICAIVLGVAEQYIGAFFLVVLMVLQGISTFAFTIHYRKR